MAGATFLASPVHDLQFYVSGKRPVLIKINDYNLSKYNRNIITATFPQATHYHIWLLHTSAQQDLTYYKATLVILLLSSWLLLMKYIYDHFFIILRLNKHLKFVFLDQNQQSILQFSITPLYGDLESPIKIHEFPPLLGHGDFTHGEICNVRLHFCRFFSMPWFFRWCRRKAKSRNSTYFILDICKWRRWH